jgi:hypothetical protein
MNVINSENLRDRRKFYVGTGEFIKNELTKLKRVSKRHPVFRHFKVVENTLFRVVSSAGSDCKQLVEIKDNYYAAVGVAGDCNNDVYVYVDKLSFDYSCVRQFDLVLHKETAYGLQVYEQSLQNYLRPAFHYKNDNVETAAELQKFIDEHDGKDNYIVMIPVKTMDKSNKEPTKAFLISDKFCDSNSGAEGYWVVGSRPRVGDPPEYMAYSADHFEEIYTEWKGE